MFRCIATKDVSFVGRVGRIGRWRRTSRRSSSACDELISLRGRLNVELRHCPLGTNSSVANYTFSSEEHRSIRASPSELDRIGERPRCRTTPKTTLQFPSSVSPLGILFLLCDTLRLLRFPELSHPEFGGRGRSTSSIIRSAPRSPRTFRRERQSPKCAEWIWG